MKTSIHTRSAKVKKLEDVEGELDDSLEDDDYGLLQYRVEFIEKKFKDLLKLDEDITHVRVMCKVSLGEMNKNITMLRPCLTEFLAKSIFIEVRMSVTNW